MNRDYGYELRVVQTSWLIADSAMVPANSSFPNPPSLSVKHIIWTIYSRCGFDFVYIIATLRNYITKKFTDFTEVDRGGLMFNNLSNVNWGELGLTR